MNADTVSEILWRIVIIFMVVWMIGFSIDRLRMQRKKRDLYEKLKHDVKELKAEVERIKKEDNIDD